MTIPFLERRRPQWSLKPDFAQSDAMIENLPNVIAHKSAVLPAVPPGKLQAAREELDAIISLNSEAGAAS